jgi:hypothetical protein
MDKELLEKELKAVALQSIVGVAAGGRDYETREIIDAMKDYIKEKYSHDNIDIDVDHLDLEFDHKANGIDLDSIIIFYGNLYTFVLSQGVYVPYYDWIYDRVFENEEFVFSQRIYTDFAGGGTKSSYSTKNKNTNQVRTYDGNEIRIMHNKEDMEDPETGERPH